MDARKHSMYIYGTRSSGLTGNQLKLIGIAAVLIDNLGAVVIQGVILQGGVRSFIRRRLPGMAICG